jgi:hypothetical protein
MKKLLLGLIAFLFALSLSAQQAKGPAGKEVKTGDELQPNGI